MHNLMKFSGHSFNRKLVNARKSESKYTLHAATTSYFIIYTIISEQRCMFLDLLWQHFRIPNWATVVALPPEKLHVRHYNIIYCRHLKEVAEVISGGTTFMPSYSKVPREVHIPMWHCTSITIYCSLQNTESILIHKVMNSTTLKANYNFTSFGILVHILMTLLRYMICNFKKEIAAYSKSQIGLLYVKSCANERER
jgi:hypothetical protein